MTTPSSNQYPVYKGKLLGNQDWSALIAQIVTTLTSGNYDLTLNSLTMESDIDINNGKLLNLATPSAGTDAVNKSYVDGLSKLAFPTYCALSGKTTSGYADFITAGTDKVTIVSGGANANLVLSYPDGTQETLNANVDVTGLAADGTYTFVKQYGVATPLAIKTGTNTITESLTAPSSPVNGDYWLDISINPYIPYKRVAGAWVATQFVKLGEVTRSTTVGTPISYPFYKNWGIKLLFPDYTNGVSKSLNTVYQSDADGWLYWYARCYQEEKYLYVGPTSSPSTPVGHVRAGATVSDYVGGSAFVPITKGTYYQGNASAGTLTFYPCLRG